MKTTILIVLLLACAACKARSVKDELKDNRALMVDIDKAKANMTSVANSAGVMSSQEMMTAFDLNEWGVQYQMYELYKKLLSFQINETAIDTIRNQSDSTVINISTQFVNALQEPRNVRNTANRAWYHLDIFNLDTLSEHINLLETSGVNIWNGVIDLENQMKTFQKDFKSSVDAITTSLSEVQKMDVKYILDSMKTNMDDKISNLLMTRIQFRDASNNAVASLKLVLSQVP